MEKFDEEMIRLGISLEKDSKTALYFSSILSAYNGEEVSFNDSLIEFAFKTQKEKIDKFLEEKKSISEQNKKNGSIGLQKRWNASKESPIINDDFLSVEAEQVEKYPFEEFWNAYGKKRNKQRAIHIWNLMPDDDKKLAMDKLPEYIAFVEDDARRKGEKYLRAFQMYPDKYLIGKRWEDDYTITENNAAYGSNIKKSIREQEFERNAQILKDNMARAERGELAYLDPTNTPAKEFWEFQRDMENG